MTKLRDDGCLETDDPVVAACFLGRRGVIVRTEGGSRMPARLDSVAADQTYSHGIPSPYPIRIPAATVAEVECGNSGIEPHWLLLCHSVDVTGSQRTLIQWLRKHTQETP